MKKSFYLFFLAFMTAVAGMAQKSALPSAIVPDGLGYNIHFTDAKEGELEMLAASGATIVRMDFGWSGTERQKGVYNFSAFERLTDALEKHKIRPLYILDYSNRNYDEGLSPYSPEGRAAFTKWATAAALHFKNRGIIWEMYNEPNIHFWKPEPKPDDYILLALEVGKALREAAPNELYIGPATSEIDFDFLERCFKAGLLEYWDAVSVHPYRQRSPETVISEYAKLRRMIERYAPKGKHIPILSAEWGYSSVWGNYNDDLQGKMLVRQWLVNLACAVPISIWYDWHDDGVDPKEPEHHFGTVNFQYFKDRVPVYDPKPSYIAARTFNETFRGYKYNKNIFVGDNANDLYVFLFENGKDVRLAVWTTKSELQTVTIPCSQGTFKAISYLGDELPDVKTDANGLTVCISDKPVYLIPAAQNSALLKAVNSKPSYPLALKMSIPMIENKDLIIHFDNTGGEVFLGKLQLKDISGIKFRSTKPVRVHLKEGEFESMVRIPLSKTASGDYRFTYSIKQDAGDGFSIKQTQRFYPIDNFSKYDLKTLNENWEVVPDGDMKVSSEQSLSPGNNGALKLTYQFGDGWKFLRLVPKNTTLAKIEDQPQALALRIDADGSGSSIRIRFRHSQGQTFQVDGEKMNIKGMMYFTFDLTGKQSSSWGGPKDGIVHYPIAFDSIIIDGARKACCTSYSIEIFPPMLVFGE